MRAHALFFLSASLLTFDITIYTEDFQNEFISLTDIARYKSDEPNDVIKNWMRNRDTIEFLGLWESLHNPDFKPVEFDGFKKENKGQTRIIYKVKKLSTVFSIAIYAFLILLFLIKCK